MEDVIRGLESAPRGADGVPQGLASFDRRLLEAGRKAFCGYLGAVYSSVGTAGARGAHSVRRTQVLTALGWTEAAEGYVPGRPSALRAALGLAGKATAAARDAAVRCGALCGSFAEGADTLRRLAGLDVRVSKLRDMTLAFGKDRLAAQDAAAPDRREYAKRPRRAEKKTERTLFAMLDGAAANCCKADTRDVKGKDGEAGTRQVRVGVFGEYGWLDAKGRPAPYADSFSYLVSGEGIADVTALAKKLGLARGAGSAPRMQCVADGEDALEKALRDAFPHAVFTNDFYHACEHTHALCLALGLAPAEADKEYRFLKGLLYRCGALGVVRRVKRKHKDALAASETAAKELAYLEKRLDNMRYGWLRKNGYFIGSGHVEAAARVLVVRRCKQAGMHWRLANAVRVCAIHAYYRSHPKAA